jgi:hypothetical protein
MKKIRLILLALLLVSPMAKNVHGYTGNDMQKYCKAEIYSQDNQKYKDMQGTVDGSMCLAYLTGVQETHDSFSQDLMKKVFCIPNGVSTAQKIRVVLKYMELHPEKLHISAEYHVIKAFMEAFPCN